MRVILDTSVLLSDLLSRNSVTSSTGVLVRSGLVGAYILLFVDAVTEELGRKVRERPDLAARIPVSDAEELITELRAVAEPVPPLEEPYPQIGRDRNDDFLLAHAVFARADYLVSWDKDLLDLGPIDGLRIVSPADFLVTLRAAGLMEPSPPPRTSSPNDISNVE